jgi:hypothetical protein
MQMQPLRDWAFSNSIYRIHKDFPLILKSDPLTLHKRVSKQAVGSHENMHIFVTKQIITDYLYKFSVTLIIV